MLKKRIVNFFVGVTTLGGLLGILYVAVGGAGRLWAVRVTGSLTILICLCVSYGFGTAICEVVRAYRSGSGDEGAP